MKPKSYQDKIAAAAAAAAAQNSSGMHVLYDEQEFCAAQKRVTDRDLHTHFVSMSGLGPERIHFVMDGGTRRRVFNLNKRAPHLSEATDKVLGALAVSKRMGGKIRMPHLLLSGPPAAGKTWWAREIAKALQLPTRTIAMPKVTASFVLSGSSSSWSHAKPGAVVGVFVNSTGASPIIILDEVDKISDGNYDPEPALLDLLERTTAAHWRDEFFDCEFDVSQAIIIATANHSETMDPALRSRFLQIPVKAPRGDDLQLVIASAWASHCEHYDGLGLPPELPADVVEGLSRNGTHIRNLQRVFDEAISRAALRSGKMKLLPADFGVSALRLVRP